MAFRRRKSIPIIIWACFLSLEAHAVRIGDPLPACVLRDIESQAKAHSWQQNDEVLYVDFWASWCKPCAQSFGFLNTLHREYQDAGLRVVAVNVDEQPADAREFLRRVPASFELARDPTGDCARALDVKGMPSSFIVDRSGVVRYAHIGFRAGDRKSLRAAVQSLLKEKK